MGTGDQRHGYTFIRGRPVRSLKDKIRALTRGLSQQHLGETLIRINQITRGWANGAEVSSARVADRRLVPTPERPSRTPVIVINRGAHGQGECASYQGGAHHFHGRRERHAK